MIFVSFIVLLYGVIFPNYYFLTDLVWYYTVIPFLLVIFLIYQGMTFLSTKLFEKSIINKFGEYEKVVFIPSKDIDKSYYRLFKIELAKALSLIVLIIMCFQIGSPFKIAQNWIQHKKIQ